MNNFSPYKYRIDQFSEIKDLDSSHIENFFSNFSFLVKPIKRNVYKLSLAQMLNYFVDFGVGYNSVCTTAITSYQSFATGKYVNRHGTTSGKRPATIADVKMKMIDVIKALVRHTVNDFSQSENNNTYGIQKHDTIFPKYIFTLDTNKTLDKKLSSLTNQNYKDVSDDFKDFAYTSNVKHTMPLYPTGYIPPDLLLTCPAHNHSHHQKMNKSMIYKYSSHLRNNGTNIMWERLAAPCNLALFETYHWDSSGLNDSTGIASVSATHVEIQGSASWQFPSSVECFENEAKLPENTITANGEKVVTVRYPGRRYRLFKRENNTLNPVFTGDEYPEEDESVENPSNEPDQS